MRHLMGGGIGNPPEHSICIGTPRIRGFTRSQTQPARIAHIEDDDNTTGSSCVNGDRLAMSAAISIVQGSSCWLGQTRLCLTLLGTDDQGIGRKGRIEDFAGALVARNGQGIGIEQAKLHQH
jgi:hypothetical protein